MRVCWFSAGVSSFVACYLAKEVDAICYIDIEDQHADSKRFVEDCGRLLGKEIEKLKSPYRNVENVCLANRYVNGPAGAKCTQILKKRVRKKWESEHPGRHTYIWGFDVNEKTRAERLVESMPEFDHEFPLIDRGVTKKEAHGICASLGLRRPAMYELGYNNNNCIGCVKGGMGYWNKIRVDFPEVFQRRSKMERTIGRSCIKGVYLDELDARAGRMTEEILPECGVACELLDTEVLLDE